MAVPAIDVSLFIPIGQTNVLFEWVDVGSPAAASDAYIVISHPDSDGDGVADGGDGFPNSNIDATVEIDGCNSGVGNQTLSDGFTFNDRIGEAALPAGSKNHGHFVKQVSQMSIQWKKDGLISGRDKGKITSCAANSALPPP